MSRLLIIAVVALAAIFPTMALATAQIPDRILIDGRKQGSESTFPRFARNATLTPVIFRFASNNPSERISHMKKMAVPVWPSPGLFPVRAVGVSHSRKVISDLVRRDTASVYFMPVLLFPYSNPDDPNAVAITTIVAPQKLGHLPRELAQAYRERMSGLGFDGPSACSAAISGGWEVGDRRYDFALELDLVLADAPAFDVAPIEPRSEPLWKRLTDDTQQSQSFKVWLRERPELLHSSMSVSAWTKPEWGTVNYFAERQKGAGYGLKLVEVDCQQHEQWFGNRKVEADLFDIDGRWATVYLDPVDESGLSARWSRHGGHSTRRVLILQEKLSATYRLMRGCKDPERKLALALEGQALQYELSELRNQSGPDGRALKEMADANWNLITQAYIGVIVRALLAADKVEEARVELEEFLNRAPQHAQSTAIVSLGKALYRNNSGATSRADSNGAKCT